GVGRGGGGGGRGGVGGRGPARDRRCRAVPVHDAGRPHGAASSGRTRTALTGAWSLLLDTGRGRWRAQSGDDAPPAHVRAQRGDGAGRHSGSEVGMRRPGADVLAPLAHLDAPLQPVTGARFDSLAQLLAPLDAMFRTFATFEFPLAYPVLLTHSNPLAGGVHDDAAP